MSLLIDLLMSIYRGAIEIFVLDTAGDREPVKRQLWVARLVVGGLVAVSAVVVWAVTSPIRWVAAIVGLLAVGYGLYAEFRYR